MSTRTRLVLVPLPYQGHLNPMLQLGTILHSNGFSITVVHTHFNSPHPSTHPHFTFLPIPDGLSDHQLSSPDFVDVIFSLNINCEVPLQDLLAHIQDQPDKIACIIYDGAMYCVDAVANHLNLPTINLRTMSAATALTYTIYPQLHKKGHIPLQDSMLEDPIPEFSALRFRDLPIYKCWNVNAYMQLLSNLSDIRSSSAVVWNTLDCLEDSSLAQLQQQYQVPIFCIGPFHKSAKHANSRLIKEDAGCIEWLDKQAEKSVLYVSIGSVALVDEQELAEMAWGLANSHSPFLWVIRPGSVASSEWIELLPKGFQDSVRGRGHIVKWAPQGQVLAHGAVGGFWSHCGWNSTIESLSEGVPMMCRPCFGDQKINARYLSQVWRVGLQLENDLERGDIERGVRVLMEEKQGEDMRKRAMDIKEKIHISSNQGGSSYNSLSNLLQSIPLYLKPPSQQIHASHSHK